MKTFAIKEMECLCGIKAHTLRTWELRYGVLQPGRKNTSVRHYTVDELEKALQLCLLNRNGYRISQLARFSNAELSQKTGWLFTADAQLEKAVNSLLICMYRMNVEGFENILDSCLVSLPLADVVENIIYPFLQRVNLLFQGKRLTEEHLVVTVVRKKLLYAIEKTEAKNPNGKKICLFLGGERQLDLFLLYTSFGLKRNGYAVINLGADVSVKNLSEITLLHRPDYLLTYCPKKGASLASVFSEINESGDFAPTLIQVMPKRGVNKVATESTFIEVYYEDVWALFQQETEMCDA